ncbi:hypothetical protein FHY08_000703 [Pseudomonas koreensis]|nr:hypothetical protein [Pseudomonas koreensis]
MLWVVWVNIRFFGCGGWRFRPYGEALFPDAEKVPKKACSYVRPSQARVPSLRDRSGRSGSGLLRCTSFRCVWLRQTVAALPRPDQSLRSAFRRRRWIKSTRACAHCVGAAEGCDLLLLLFCGSEPRPGWSGLFCFLGVAAFGPAMLWVVWVNIRCCGVADYGSALTAGHLFQTPKRLAPTFGPRRLGFLRCGIDPLSLPTSPVDQKQDQKHSSLRSLCRSCRRLRSFAFAFLWERACSRRRPDSRPDSWMYNVPWRFRTGRAVRVLWPSSRQATAKLRALIDHLSTRLFPDGHDR